MVIIIIVLLTCHLVISMQITKMKSLRGALVVVEGCDRSGKTTQCRKLVNSLQSENIPAEYMNFPGKHTTSLSYSKT